MLGTKLTVEGVRMAFDVNKMNGSVHYSTHESFKYDINTLLLNLLSLLTHSFPKPKPTTPPQTTKIKIKINGIEFLLSTLPRDLCHPFDDNDDEFFTNSRCSWRIRTWRNGMDSSNKNSHLRRLHRWLHVTTRWRRVSVW